MKIIQIQQQIGKKPIMIGSKTVILTTLHNNVPDYLDITNAEG